MKVDIVEFGNRVRAERVRSDMSQSDLEKATGLKQNIISAVERGVYGHQIRDAHRIIATHFGIEIPEGGDEDSMAEEAVTNGNGHDNNAVTEFVPMRAVTMHKAEGVDVATDALITCILGLEPLDATQRKRVMKSLAAWVEE